MAPTATAKPAPFLFLVAPPVNSGSPEVVGLAGGAGGVFPLGSGTGLASAGGKVGVGVSSASGGCVAELGSGTGSELLVQVETAPVADGGALPGIEGA